MYNLLDQLDQFFRWPTIPAYDALQAARDKVARTQGYRSLDLTTLTRLIEAARMYRSSLLPQAVNLKFEPDRVSFWEPNAQEDQAISAMTAARRMLARGIIKDDKAAGIQRVQEELLAGLNRTDPHATGCAQQRVDSFAETAARKAYQEEGTEVISRIPVLFPYPRRASEDTLFSAQVIDLILWFTPGQGNVLSRFHEDAQEIARAHRIIRHTCHVLREDPDAFDVEMFLVDYPGGFSDPREKGGTTGGSYELSLAVGVAWHRRMVRETALREAIPFVCTGIINTEDDAIEPVKGVDLKVPAAAFRTDIESAVFPEGNRREMSIALQQMTNQAESDLAIPGTKSIYWFSYKQKFGKKFVVFTRLEYCLDYLSLLKRTADIATLPLVLALLPTIVSISLFSQRVYNEKWLVGLIYVGWLSVAATWLVKNWASIRRRNGLAWGWRINMRQYLSPMIALSILLIVSNSGSLPEASRPVLPVGYYESVKAKIAEPGLLSPSTQKAVAWMEPFFDQADDINNPRTITFPDESVRLLNLAFSAYAKWPDAAEGRALLQRRCQRLVAFINAAAARGQWDVLIKVGESTNRTLGVLQSERNRSGDYSANFIMETRLQILEKLLQATNRGI